MAKEYSRTQRLARLLREEISQLLQREVKDTRVGLVTVSDVEVSSDLKYATVYVQAPGDEAEKAETLKGLTSAAGFLRSRLGRELRIRRAPELRFVLDRTQERAARIHQLLAEVKGEEGEPGGGDEG
ncbi:MAG: 30S ribosome-binding factor RbfA [Gemmatimonadota bacterium]|nr:MAG: 30S ribosome-binding factor RbfA [Gemmatimonadota bacterium]